MTLDGLIPCASQILACFHEIQDRIHKLHTHLDIVFRDRLASATCCIPPGGPQVSGKTRLLLILLAFSLVSSMDLEREHLDITGTSKCRD